MTFHVQLSADGRIMIPAALRRELGLHDGASLTIGREGDSLVVRASASAPEDDMRREIRQGFGNEYSVDRFLAERSADWSG